MEAARSVTMPVQTVSHQIPLPCASLYLRPCGDITPSQMERQQLFHLFFAPEPDKTLHHEASGQRSSFSGSSPLGRSVTRARIASFRGAPAGG